MIRRLSQNVNKDFVFEDFFPNQRTQYLFMTHYLEDHEELPKINAHIIQSILQLDIPSIPSDAMESSLKDFFLELNWRCFSMFNKLPIAEKGVSLLLLILRDNELYLMQFGRLLCGISSKDTCSQIGVPWENFVIKTKDDLLLLGNLGQDIFPKVLRPELISGDQLFSLPYPHTRELECATLCHEILDKTIDSLLEKEMIPHLVFQADRCYNGATLHKKRRKKNRVSGS